MSSRPALATVTLLALLGSGCGDGGSSNTDGGAATCVGDVRAMTYAGGMSLSGKQGQFKVELTSAAPAPPYKGNNSWMIKVTDATTGTALDDLKVDATPFMPDHGHPTPIKVVVTPMPAMGAGVYKLAPVNLFMAGVWEVTVTASSASSADLADGSDMAGPSRVDQVVFVFCIEG